MSFSRVFRALRWLALSVALALPLVAVPDSALTQEPTFRNPVLAFRGADPWIVVHEGNYHLITTSGASEFFMRKAPTLAGLQTAKPVRVWQDRLGDRGYIM